MNADAICAQPCFILRHKPYRESSLILDVLSQDFGRFSLLAKGVRKAKSKTAPFLQAFGLLNISYLYREELKILTDVYSPRFPFKLQGLALYCGFYINELLMRLTFPDDPIPELFFTYQNCLTSLAERDDDSIQAILRRFEVKLLEYIGYGLQLHYDIKTARPVVPELRYSFVIEQGPYQDDTGLVTGQTLLALSTGQYNVQTLHEAKKLMRIVIDHYLQGKPLKSRQVINQIMKKLGHE